MSLRSRLNRLELRTGKVVENCPGCRNWIALVADAREVTPELRTCPDCGRVRTGLVVVMEGYTPELAR